MTAAKKFATYADLEALPSHQVGEIVNGTLYASPRPAPPHARSASRLGSKLGRYFDDDDGVPGGWVLLYEPELHLGDDVVVPDFGGWRRERMPEMPVDKAYFTLAPDWVCEVLSPSTEPLDRGEKLAVYRDARVSHVWLVNPLVKTLEVLRFDGGTYRVLPVFSGDAKVRAEPFDAIELELAALWRR